MKYLIYLSCVTAIGAASLMAQPVVKTGGAVNAASYAPVGLPNSAIAQGSIFVIFGSKMGPATLQQITKYPVPINLGGTAVQVTVTGTTVNAFIFYTSDSQIAAIMPSNTPIGTGSLAVTYNGQGSNAIAVQVVRSSPGIFAANSGGTGPGIIANAQSVVYGLTTAAQTGETGVIWLTGIGPVAGDEAGGPLPGDMPNNPVEVYVGLQKATLTYRGRSGCCAGLDQIGFVIPPGVTGCRVPIAVKIGNVVSNTVTMPIAPTGRVCSDQGGPSTTDISKYAQQGTVAIGSVNLGRSTTTSVLSPPFGTGVPTTTTTDSGSAAFLKYDFAQLSTAQNPFGVITIGACTEFFGTGLSVGAVADPIKPKGLDAGAAINVSGPRGAKQLTQIAMLPGFYSAQLGGGSGPTATPLYLDAGSYTITGPGGADVGSFSALLNVLAPLTWTNQGSISTVQRATGVDVTWTGGDPSGIVNISGSSISLGNTPDFSDVAVGFFVCTAPVSAGHFTVPPLVLLNLPASGSNSAFPIDTGNLSVGTSVTSTFTATGLDIGTVNSSVSIGKGVTYQ